MMNELENVSDKHIHIEILYSINHREMLTMNDLDRMLSFQSD